MEVIRNMEMPYKNDIRHIQDNDVVILKLEAPLIFNNNVKPACLPNADWQPEHVKTKCITSGWGKREDGRYSNHLIWTDVPLMSNSDCKRLVKEFVKETGGSDANAEKEAEGELFKFCG